MLISSTSVAQLGDYHVMIDTLLTEAPVSGFMWWKPNTFIPGECFQQYRTISGDSDNNAVLEKSWTDDILDMTHYRYRQTYKDIPIECATAIEHFDKNNELIFTNAKFAIELDRSVTPQLTESAAKQELMNYLPSYWIMAWDDTEWETELQEELGDPMATHEPTGELILAIDDYTYLNFYIPASRYRLAYRYKVVCVSPYSNVDYFVDANTGEVFKELSNQHHDDLATVLNSGGTGTKVIDTRWRGFPHYDFVLETNDDDVEIHTKKHDSTHAFNYRHEIDKAAEPWTGFQINATSTHWYVQQSWYYFRDVFGRDGMTDDFGKIRVHVELASSKVNAYYDDFDGWDNLTFHIVDGLHVGNYADIVGHEFTHGIINHTSKLIYSAESGVLNESYADIMGIMVKRHALMGGVGTPSWTLGDPAALTRSLSHPNDDGKHAIVIDDTCRWFLGQPHTYEGVFWQDTDVLCDARGVHGNSGVQNHWFYLLAQGGSGTNDNSDDYNVTSIGIDIAARIAYATMVSINLEGAQYSDARQGSIAIARVLYGECSNEHYQTTNAWYAVGVGEESECTEVLSLDSEIDLDEFRLYPNPVDHGFAINWESTERFDLTIYGMSGEILFFKKEVHSDDYITLPQITNGVYVVELRNEKNVIRKRIIKK
ncbi:MAG: T9SS type A sorting domain-containing protein [Crocinitomix sp.]|nr:T9SS type A sorting domain-containing protein [Crocinitomix sp.]